MELFPINKEVSVSAFYFKNYFNNGRNNMRSYPKQIELDGTEVSFRDGLSYLVRKGQQMIQLFDMKGADDNTYRLRRAGNQWTLVGMKAGA